MYVTPFDKAKALALAQDFSDAEYVALAQDHAERKFHFMEYLDFLNPWVGEGQPMSDPAWVAQAAQILAPFWHLTPTDLIEAYDDATSY